jgi:hypothetical protein
MILAISVVAILFLIFYSGKSGAETEAETLIPAYFSAQLGPTHQSVNDNPGIIVWDQIDLNKNISHSNGNITVAQSGIYCISVTGVFFGYDISERYCIMEFKSDGITMRSAVGQITDLEVGNDYGSVSMSFVCPLTGGVEYSFNFGSGNDGNVRLEYRTHCSLHRIS